MATTIEHLCAIFESAGIAYDLNREDGVIRTAWTRDESALVLLVFLMEDGELVQLRVADLLKAPDDATRPLLHRAMLHMAYDMRLVQFEYDPEDSEICTSLDIAIEDGQLSSDQLLRCCSVLLDVSFMARDRLGTIMETGRDLVLEAATDDTEPGQGQQPDMHEMMRMAEAKRSRGDA